MICILFPLQRPVNFFAPVATRRPLACDNLPSGQAETHERFRTNAPGPYGKNNFEVQAIPHALAGTVCQRLWRLFGLLRRYQPHYVPLAWDACSGHHRHNRVCASHGRHQPNCGCFCGPLEREAAHDRQRPHPRRADSDAYFCSQRSADFRDLSGLEFRLKLFCSGAIRNAAYHCPGRRAAGSKCPDDAGVLHCAVVIACGGGRTGGMAYGKILLLSGRGQLHLLCRHDFNPFSNTACATARREDRKVSGPGFSGPETNSSSPMQDWLLSSLRWQLPCLY